jgi:peptidoglycan/LPS O-acetylase OafA/YrhL
MDSTPRPRLEALTGLRYVAALCVLLAHMGYHLPPEPKEWVWFIGLSSLGMPLFFVLSGFLMAYNYSALFRARFGRTLWSYGVARFARIYPVYAACLLLSFSFMGNFFNDLRDRPADTYKSLAYVGTLTQSWGHVPVFADNNPRTVCQSYLGVAWSVSTEAFFYLVFPLVAIPLARFVTGRGRAVGGVAAVYAAYMIAGYVIFHRVPAEFYDSPALGNSRQWWKLYLCPYMRFGEFLMGALLGQYFLTRADRPAPAGWRWYAGAGLLAAAPVLALGLNYRLLLPHKFGVEPLPRWLEFASYNLLFAPFCATVVYQLAALPCLAGRALGSRPMVMLGEMSYCMYLLHPLVQSFFHQRTGGEGPMKDWYVVAYNNLAMVAVLHLLCLGMYRYWEVPARTLLRDLLDPKPKPTLAVVGGEPAPARRAA